MRFTTVVAVSLLACAGGPIAQADQASSPLAVAVRQAQQGQCRDAVVTLESAIRANPSGGENLYLLLSQCHASLGDPAQAVAALRTGMGVYRDSPVIQRALGQLLFRTRYDSVEAGSLLANAARMLPDDPAARHYYAQWAYLNGQPDACVTQERAALALPGLTDLAAFQMNTLLGMCSGQLPGEDAADAARAAFERATAINAGRDQYDPVSAFQYVQFLTRQGDDVTAQRIVDQILERVPRFGPAHLEKAKFHDRNGDPARAIAEARTALASDGNDINTERAAHLLMARSHALLGNAEEAAAEQRWIEAHPNPETPRYTPPHP